MRFASVCFIQLRYQFQLHRRYCNCHWSGYCRTGQCFQCVPLIQCCALVFYPFLFQVLNGATSFSCFETTPSPKLKHKKHSWIKFEYFMRKRSFYAYTCASVSPKRAANFLRSGFVMYFCI